MSKRIAKILLLVGFYGIALFLTFNKHSKSGYYNYHSQIWADKAGYHVYLPAALKYNFKASNFPDSIAIKTGNGFSLDAETDKVITKYSSGVAIMQLPFYCAADALSGALDSEPDGFSPVYHWAINIAAVTYLLLGLLCLYEFLKVRFNGRIALITCAILFLGTNLYYYAIVDTGMSHIYSFALFCYFLYFIQKTNYLERQSVANHFKFGFLIGLIVLIRPTNLIFLSAFLLIDVSQKDALISRIKRALAPRFLIPVLVGAVLVFIPQFMYSYYAYGSFLSYSYGDEGFNWLQPVFLNSWFSPNNGLFLYTPFYVVILAAIFAMIRNKVTNGWFVLVTFGLISYVFASWWNWNFGCSFGARNYVEYLALFSIPLAYLIHKVSQLSKPKMALFGILILAFVVFNLKLIYTYDSCYFGVGDWDWDYYSNLVFSSTK